MRTLLTAILCVSALSAADAVRRAPGFALPDSRGNIYDLADYRGKIVVLEFMQTTCPHCATFTGILNQLQQRYGGKVAVLSVVNPPDAVQNVNTYASAHQVTYPIVMDCGQMAYSYLRVQSFDLPQLYLIDENGMIQKEFAYSDSTKDVFEGKALFSHLDAMLKKK
jgi:peroxiredoxin